MHEPNATAATEDFEFAALSEALNYRNAIINEFKSFLGGRVLEVGAGIGQTSEAILRLPGVRELVALEPDPRFQDRFRKRLPDVLLVGGTTRDLPDGETFSSAVMVNVLEHIEHDLAELAALRQILLPAKGHLCILVPARPEIFSKLDAHFGHFRRYTRVDLRDKLHRAGFDIVSLHYFNFVGYFAWWLRFKVMQSMSFDINQVRLFDRRIFPVAYALESRLVRPPVGQSLIAVARAV